MLYKLVAAPFSLKLYFNVYCEGGSTSTYPTFPGWIGFEISAGMVPRLRDFQIRKLSGEPWLWKQKSPGNLSGPYCRTKCYYPAGIARLKENSLLDEHIKCISETLSDDIILKLALLTWHFDASSQSPSKELLEFFAHPEGNVDVVCQILCERYSAYTGRYTRWSEFGKEFAYHLGVLEFAMTKGWNLVLQLKSSGQLFME